MATQWPLVVNRLLDLLPTLPHWSGVTVIHGAAYDPPTAVWATVAHSTDGVTTAAGAYTKQQAGDGFRLEEQGSVACQITDNDDRQGDIGAVQTALFALLDDLEDAIRADRTLGLSPETTTALTVDVSSMQSVPGIATTLAFSIDYYTVT